jgi:two-component system, OmpR family, KDP operon response regulator KdpE
MTNRNRKRLLLADNLAQYRKSLRVYLELEGYEVVEAGTVEDAIELLKSSEFDLVLADLRMRDDDDSDDWGGIEIAKFASQRGIPCVIVTAFPSVDVARIALRARGGEPYAQDLVTKASGPQAVLDAIETILHGRGPNPVGDEGTQVDGLRLDLTRQLVWKHNKLLKLSKNQYILLETLYKKDGGLCSCVELILAIYNEELSERIAQNDRRLRNLIDRTKEKIEDKGSGHEYIEVVTGRGYRLNLKH